jgi:hypothetical protein
MTGWIGDDSHIRLTVFETEIRNFSLVPPPQERSPTVNLALTNANITRLRFLTVWFMSGNICFCQLPADFRKAVGMHALANNYFLRFALAGGLMRQLSTRSV